MIALAILGLLGGTCFAISGVPAAWGVVRDGRNRGTPISAAWAIVCGSVCTFVYLTVLHGVDPIIWVNYLPSILSWGIIVWYSYFPRKGGRG